MLQIKFNIIWYSAVIFGRLPYHIQYLFSDILYLLLYCVVGYRKKVVRGNLSRSFPEKNTSELRKIERRFYAHLCDIFIETIAAASLSEKELAKRIVFDNPEVVLNANGDRAMIAAMSHYGQWEFASRFSIITNNEILAVYHPLSGKLADMFYKKMRTRIGATPIPMHSSSRELMRSLARNENCILALIADQTPPGPISKEWIMFLNQPTAFFTGIDRLATQFKMSVVYLELNKPKRGYYRVHCTQIYDGTEEISVGDITKRYASMLENSIKKDPAYWLWSHKRWKHLPPEDFLK